MGSTDATRRVPWLRYALLGIVIGAIWLAFSLLSGAVGGASAEENTPAVVPAHGVDPVSPTTPPQAAAPEVDAPPGPADAANHAPAAPAAEHPARVEPADAGRPADAGQNPAPGSLPVAASVPDRPTAQPAIEHPEAGNPANAVHEPAPASAAPPASAAAPASHPAPAADDKPDHVIRQPATPQPAIAQPPIEHPTGQPETDNPADAVLENETHDLVAPNPAQAFGPPVVPSPVTDVASAGRGASSPPSGLIVLADGDARAMHSNEFDQANTASRAADSISPAGGTTNGGAPLGGGGPGAVRSVGGAASGGAGAGGAGSGGAGSSGAGASGTSDATFAAQEFGARAALALNSTDDELPSSPVFGADTTPD